MKKRLFPTKNEKLNSLITILFFVFCISIIVSVYPKEGKFRFEFQKGAPWLHENLMAPFNFAIYKTDEELKEEKDSILENFSPYYNLDSLVEINQLKAFAQEFDSQWQSMKRKYDTLSFENSFVQELQNEGVNLHTKQKYKNKIFIILKGIYDKGLIEYHEFTNKEMFILVNNNIVQSYYYFEDVYTLKSAYEYLINELKIIKNPGNKREADELDFIKDLNINEYLLPNIVYDRETSTNMKNSLIENISLNTGMVQKGERIIYRGEVVNKEKYRILESLKHEFVSALGDHSSNILVIIGQIIFVSFAFFVLFLFMFNFRYDILKDTLKTIFILLLIISFVFLANKIIDFHIISLNLVPFAIVPVITRIFYDTRLALFVHIITILLVGFLAPNSFEFVYLQFVAGIIAIISLRTLRKRGQIFTSSIVIFITYCILYFGIALIQEGDLSKIEWTNFGWFAGNSLMLITAYPLIYVFEKTFGFLSEVTLMELADTNNELLRQLAENAPGTFQHSIQVANLAEDAIFRIGGSPLLVRVGALYHDIGKLGMPHCYTENQISGVNIHDQMDIEASASLIINHVGKGIEIAHKYKLPEPVIDFIRTHHGTSKVQFFFRLYKLKYPDKEVDENKFSYNCPKPYSKETAVLMMADAIEAASRSLKEYTEESINELVDSIIDFQIREEQFHESNVTFRDINLIKDLFKKKLKNIYHTRIAYPQKI